LRRPGISRVVVEVAVLVITIALAVFLLSPASSYILGGLKTIILPGGATSIEVIGTEGWGTYNGVIYLKNLGPRDVKVSLNPIPFQVFIDDVNVPVRRVLPPPGTVLVTVGFNAYFTWKKGTSIRLVLDLTNFPSDKKHKVVVFGPVNTVAHYIYYPP